jgi:hypothetical protein
VDGWSVTPAEAAQGEVKLARNPEDLPLRLHLMSYYMQHILNQPLAGHVFWLIEHHPDGDVFQESESIMRIPARDSDGKPSVYEARREALWKEQAGRFSRNPKVLRNAAMAISGTDPALAVQYVKAARQLEPANTEWTRWLARIYADAIRWTFWDGKANMTFLADADDYRNFPFRLPLSLCESVKKEVETSADAQLVAAIGEGLVREARLLAERSKADNSLLTADVKQVARFGELLADRARSLKAR